MKPGALLFTACCFAALFASCTKRAYKTEKAKLLEDGKWQLTAQTASISYMGVDTTIDMYAELKDCEKDDYVTFSKKGKATKDEGAATCSGRSQTATIKWELRNNDSQLYLEDDNPDTYDLEISASLMKLKIVKPNSSGVPITYLHTYKNIK